MPRLTALAALLPVLLLSGCFQIRALVRIAEDGSGTLEETVVLGAMLHQMIAAEGDSAAALDLYSVDSLRAHASRLGEGVTLLRVDSVAAGEDFGYRAVYAFRDIAELRFRFNPSPIAGRGDGRAGARSGSMLAGTTPELAVTFGRAPDGTITVRMPQAAPATPAAEPDREAVRALADSLRRQMESSGDAVTEMLGGIRMRLEVAGPGPVATTDAAFVADSSVVMFDFSLGALAGLARDKPELIARVQLEDRAGTPDTRPILRALAARPDVRYELAPEVTVLFDR